MLAYGDPGYRLGAPFLLLCGDSLNAEWLTLVSCQNKTNFLLSLIHDGNNQMACKIWYPGAYFSARVFQKSKNESEISLHDFSKLVNS